MNINNKSIEFKKKELPVWENEIIDMNELQKKWNKIRKKEKLKDKK